MNHRFNNVRITTNPALKDAAVLAAIVGWKSANEIAEATGLSPRRVCEYTQRFLASGKIAKKMVGRRCYYQRSVRKPESPRGSIAARITIGRGLSNWY